MMLRVALSLSMSSHSFDKSSFRFISSALCCASLSLMRLCIQYINTAQRVHNNISNKHALKCLFIYAHRQNVRYNRKVIIPLYFKYHFFDLFFISLFLFLYYALFRIDKFCNDTCKTQRIRLSASRNHISRIYVCLQIKAAL